MPHNPLPKSHFTLDASGVAGFFGGDEAIYAMGTVPFYQNRKWLGWYNSPGSYTVAKKYGQIAHAEVWGRQSGIWNGLFPGDVVNPADLFRLSGTSGPGYSAAHSGTSIPDTGHIGHLFMRECEAPEVPIQWIKGKRDPTSRMTVTIATLGECPKDDKLTIQALPHPNIILMIISIVSSLAVCILCGVYKDWYCFSMILLGIVTNGLSCLAIGSVTITFTHPKSAKGVPKGDGIMKRQNGVVVLFGVEKSVASVTRGAFELEFAPNANNAVGLCSLLMITQFLAQLLLIPQGTLFGQIMFVASLAVSWMYNSHLSSSTLEEIQRKILRKQVLPYLKLKKYGFYTRTTMAVFVLLVLQPQSPEQLLNSLLPHDTNTWRIWQRVVLEKVRGDGDLSFDEANYDGVDDKERPLLKALYDDAETAYTGFQDYRLNKPVDDSGGKGLDSV